MKSYSIRTIIRSLLLLFFTISFILAGLNIQGAIVAILLSEVGTFLFLMFISKRFITLRPKKYYLTTKKILKLGSQLFIANAIYIVNTYTDTLLLGYFLTDADVGIYNVALALSKSFLIIPSSLSTVVYPAITEYNSKNLNESIENMVDKVLRYSLITLSTLGILMVFLSNNILLLLYGPEFLPAILPLCILIIGMIFFGSMSAIGTAFTAIGRADIPIKTNSVSAIVNVILNIILIPIYGINGAALSTSLSFILTTVLALYLLKRILNVKIEAKWQIKVLALTCLVIFSFFILNNYLNVYSLTFIFIIYLVVVSKFLLKNEDKEQILDLFKTILNKSN